MYSLVVVDMQNYFLDRFEKDERKAIIENVQKAVKQAIADNAEIINVRYDPQCIGHTTRKISSLWRGYHKVKHVSKNRDDGGYEVLAKSNGPFRVCGINLSACIKATVLTLIRNVGETNTKIIANAVANPISWGRGYTRSTLQAFNHILTKV